MSGDLVLTPLYSAGPAQVMVTILKSLEVGLSLHGKKDKIGYR